jgi:hypothetical protein
MHLHLRQRIDLRKLAYILPLGIASLFTLLSMQGCRVGNRVSSTQSSDPVTGYYGTEPQSLKFCVGGAAAKCSTGLLKDVPALISKHLTNPVALIMEDTNTGEAILTGYTGVNSAIPVWIDSDNKTLYYVNSFLPQSLWRNSTCNSHLFLEQTGEIIAGESISVPNSTRKTRGRVSLKLTLTYLFEDGLAGSCHDTLVAMSQCYNDVNLCGGVDSAQNQTLQLEVKTLFQPYISSQALSPSDIPKMNSMAYEVEYR